MREILKDKLKVALESVGLLATDIPLEHPAELKNGDYSSGVALQYAKRAGKNPRALAEAVVAAFGKIDGVAKIEVAGAGFINFYLTSQALAESVEEANNEDRWGANATEKGKTILMEYTDPNPFKEFHIGHLVPNAIGESISRLFQFSGATVKRANYQGDVGVHVAKSLFILLEKGITEPTIQDLSAAYPEGSKRYEEDAAAKEAIDALNKKIYDKSDRAVNALYEKGRALSLAHFEELYKILGTKFDFYFFESEAGPIGVKIVRAHPEVFVESDGAVVFKGEEHNLHTRVFLNKAGLPTYEAKELGLAKMKEDATSFGLTLTITANEQKAYFEVVMKAMEFALPELRGKLAFKTHGLLRFAEGKMSSRTGNIIRGEDLIADLAARAKARAAESRLPAQAGAKNPDMLAQQIAVAAIKYQILKQASHKDIIFDRERALSLEGDSGPYVQYAHARASGIMEKAKEQGVVGKVNAKVEINNLPAQAGLTRLLHRFPEIVEYAASEREPHLLTSYLLEIAGQFNGWYARVHILDGSAGAPHKVALAGAVRRTLKNGLSLLGIPAPEKM